MGDLVSIVMTVYNAQCYVKEALDSVIEQTYENLEVIVIDDGSTDRSLEVIREVAAKDSRIKVLHGANQGVPAAANRGVLSASGAFIVRMDADDVCMPNRVEVQKGFLASHTDVVAAGARALYIDAEGDPIKTVLDVFSHEEIHDALLSGRLGIINPTAIIRRDAMLSIGGYRESLAEDLDLWLRLAEIGKLANLDSVLLKYRQHESSISYKNAYAQRVAAQRAIAEAIVRGRLDRAVPPPPVEDAEATGLETVQERWAWWALSSGHVKTARKHARRAFLQRPLSRRVWKLVACAVRGH